MIRSLNTAASGMEAQEFEIDVIANNLANVNTTGFKRSRAEFQDLFYQEIRAARAGGEGKEQGSPAPLEVGQGTRAIATQKNFSNGALVSTGNQLDIAIEGQGFIRVNQPDGTQAYTRSGMLKIDADGRLTTAEGKSLDPPIEIPAEATNVIFEPDGTVKVGLSGETLPLEVGKLELTQFVNPGGLKSLGHNLFMETEASGEPINGTPGEEGLGSIQQGMIESSNVEVIEEMISLIAAQRAYEINSRVIRASDEMLRETASIR